MWCRALAVFVAAFSIGCGGSAKQPDCLRTFTGHSNYVCSVAFSPSGKQVVSGGADGKIMFWDVESGQCQRTLDGHAEWVQSVSLSPDGRFLASGGRDDLVKLWDMESGEHRKTFAGHTGLVMSVAYSPDGQLLASCGRDKVVRIWDVASGKALKSLTDADVFSSSAVSFGRDGKRVFVAGDTLQLWDIEKGECVRRLGGHADSVGAIALSRNGKWIASAGSYTDRKVIVHDAESGSSLWSKDFTEQEGGAWSLTFVSDDGVLASGHHTGAIRYWDVKSGKNLGAVEAHPGAVSCLAADASGRTLASGGWDKCVRLWKVLSGETTGQ